MSRKSARLSRVLTERSRYVGQPEDSKWIDYLEDSSVPEPVNVIANNSQLTPGRPRSEKWYLNVEDSVNVPPPVSADSNSEVASSFNSVDNNSGQAPGSRRKILVNKKRKRENDNAFNGAFEEDEPPSKRRSSSLKGQATEPVYDDASPVMNHRKSERKGALFRKGSPQKGSKLMIRNKKYNFEEALLSSDDDIFLSTSHQDSKRSPGLEKSVSPELKTRRRSKKVLIKTKPRNTRAGFDVEFSDNEEVILTSQGRKETTRSTASGRSISPESNPGKRSKKRLLTNKTRTTRAGFDVEFSSDEESRGRNETTPSSASGRSVSPEPKTGRRSHKIQLGKKSQATRVDFYAAFGNNEETNSAVISQGKKEPEHSPSSDISVSPASKRGKRSRKVLLTKKTRTPRAGFIEEFSSGEEVVSQGRKEKKHSSASGRSVSPSPELGGRSKKVLLLKKSRATRVDFDAAFGNDEVTNSADVSQGRERIETGRSSASERSVKVSMSNPGQRSKKSLLTKETRTSRVDFDVEYSSGEEATSQGRKENKHSSASGRSVSPSPELGGRSKKVLLLKKSRATRVDFDAAFGNDEVTNSAVSERSVKVSMSNPGQRSKKSLLTKETRTSRVDFDVEYSSGEEVISQEQKESQHSSALSRSVSPESKMRRHSKKVLLKERATRADFDAAFVNNNDSNEHLPASEMSIIRDVTSAIDQVPESGNAIVGSDSLVSKHFSLASTMPTASTKKRTGFLDLVIESKDVSSSSEDEIDVGVYEYNYKISAPSTSQSPGTNSRKSLKNIVVQKKSITTSGFENDIDESGKGKKIASKTASNVSRTSAVSIGSPANQGIGNQKLSLPNKSPKETPDFNFKEISDDSDGDPVISPTKSQHPSSNRSSNTNSSKRNPNKKDLMSNNSKTSEYIAGEDVVIIREDDSKLSDSVRSESPSGTLRKLTKKIIVSKKKTKQAKSGFDKVFESDEDDNNARLSLITDRDSRHSFSGASVGSTKPEKKGKNVLHHKKALRTKPDFEKAFDTEENVELENSEHMSSAASASPVISLVSGAKKELLHKKSKAKTPGFEKAFDIDENSVVNIIGNTSRASDSSLLPRVAPVKRTSINKPKLMQSKNDGGDEKMLGLLSTKTKKTKSRNDKEVDVEVASPKVDSMHAAEQTQSSVVSKLEREGQNRYSLKFSSNPDGITETDIIPKKKDVGEDGMGGGSHLILSRHSEGRVVERNANVTEESFVQKVVPITPIVSSGRSGTLLFAQETNFTNFNPQANSTKVLQSPKSAESETSREASTTGKIKSIGQSQKRSTSIKETTGTNRSRQPEKEHTNKSITVEEPAQLPVPALSQEIIPDGDVSVIGTWSGSSGIHIGSESDTTPANSFSPSPIADVETTERSIKPPPPQLLPPAQVPIPAASTSKKYSPEEAAAKRKEYFSTLLARAKQSYPEFAGGSKKTVGKQKTLTDFYAKAPLPVIPRVVKPVDPSLLVNGKRWRPPKLTRPARWCTDRLYTLLQKHTEKLYGEIKKRRKSEEFMQALASNVKIATRRKKNFEPSVLKVMYLLKRLGVITSLMDFYVFVENYMPGDFHQKAVPIARAYGEITGPKCLIGVNATEPIDFSTFSEVISEKDLSRK